jgi:transcriptional regulator with XRE-family HTH domain
MVFLLNYIETFGIMRQGIMMKERLIKLRKALKLNQGEFAERLGIKGGALSMIELGKNGLTDQNIKLICMIFNVNETWLRTGEGEMFNSAASPYEREFFEIYDGLMPETQQALLQFAKRLLHIQKKQSGKTQTRGE